MELRLFAMFMSYLTCIHSQQVDPGSQKDTLSPNTVRNFHSALDVSGSSPTEAAYVENSLSNAAVRSNLNIGNQNQAGTEIVDKTSVTMDSPNFKSVHIGEASFSMNEPIIKSANTGETNINVEGTPISVNSGIGNNKNVAGIDIFGSTENANNQFDFIGEPRNLETVLGQNTAGGNPFKSNTGMNIQDTLPDQKNVNTFGNSRSESILNTGVGHEHEIQKGLQNQVILHNFMSVPGIQEMISAAQSGQQVKPTEGNLLTELINSPLSIQNAFPDQTLIDGSNAVAVDPSRKALGASFQETKERPTLDFSSFSVQPTSSHTQNTVINRRKNNPCASRNRAIDELNPRFYYVLERGRKDTQMPCPPGVKFSEADCDCTIRIPPSKVCRPELAVIFDYNIMDTSGMFLHSETDVDLKPENGHVCFNGSQEIGIRWPRYKYFDYGDELLIKLEFKLNDSAIRYEPFPLITNCGNVTNNRDNKERPSVGIIINDSSDNVTFLLETVNGSELHTFEIHDNLMKWHSAELQYDGKFFTAKLDQQVASIPMEGRILSKPNPLAFGYCEGVGRLNGCMDKVYVYPCIPPRNKREAGQASVVERLQGWP